MGWIDDAHRARGDAFAEHLRDRSEQSALELARVLSDAGDERRADFLSSFVNEGAHTRPAGWWIPETVCHVSLKPPAEMDAGDLWFDPLETSWSMAIPRIRDPRVPGELYARMPDFCYWFALEPVSNWQLDGAHQIAPDVAASRPLVSGDNAWRYCSLFGKSLTSWTAWAMLGKAYDVDVVLRLWGDSVGEVGLGGADEESAHIVTRDNILQIKDPDAPYPEQTRDWVELGIDFRPTVNLQFGLGEDDEALERVWER